MELTTAATISKATNEKADETAIVYDAQMRPGPVPIERRHPQLVECSNAGISIGIGKFYHLQHRDAKSKDFASFFLRLFQRFTAQQPNADS